MGKVAQKNALSIRFETENPSSARRIFNIVKFLYTDHCEVSAKKINKLRTGHFYMVTLNNNDSVRKILKWKPAVHTQPIHKFSTHHESNIGYSGSFPFFR